MDERRKTNINMTGEKRRRDDVEVIYVQHESDDDNLAEGTIKLKDGLAFIGAIAAILFAGVAVWSSLNMDVTKQSLDLQAIHKDIEENQEEIKQLNVKVENLSHKIEELDTSISLLYQRAQLKK